LADCGGRGTGLLRTTNGGALWSVVDGAGLLNGLNISGVAPRGDTIVIAVNDTDDCDILSKCDDVGIWRSIHSGSDWIKISGGDSTGLPNGASSSLVGDPNKPEILYTNAGTTGLYKSTNTGALWAKVSDSDMDSLVARADNL